MYVGNDVRLCFGIGMICSCSSSMMGALVAGDADDDDDDVVVLRACVQAEYGRDDGGFCSLFLLCLSFVLLCS